MNQVVCDKCGGETKPKQITSKKTGKQYTIYECQSGCMNGKYPYSCFAPKVAKSAPTQDNNIILDKLEEIKSILLKLAFADKPAVKKAKKAIEVDPDEAPEFEEEPF